MSSHIRRVDEVWNSFEHHPSVGHDFAQVDASAINLQSDPSGGLEDESRGADDDIGAQLPTRRELDTVEWEAIDLISHDRDGSCPNCAEEVSVGRYAEALVPRPVARVKVLLHHRPADLLGDRPSEQLSRPGRSAPAVLPENLLSKDGVESPETIRRALRQQTAKPGTQPDRRQGSDVAGRALKHCYLGARSGERRSQRHGSGSTADHHDIPVSTVQVTRPNCGATKEPQNSASPQNSGW